MVQCRGHYHRLERRVVDRAPLIPWCCRYGACPQAWEGTALSPVSLLAFPIRTPLSSLLSPLTLIATASLSSHEVLLFRLSPPSRRLTEAPVSISSFLSVSFSTFLSPSLSLSLSISPVITISILLPHSKHTYNYMYMPYVCFFCPYF